MSERPKHPKLFQQQQGREEEEEQKPEEAEKESTAITLERLSGWQ
jgi:beta-catenin-like protein 1